MGKYNILIYSRPDTEELLKLFDQRQDSFVGALVKHMKNKLPEDVFFEKIMAMLESTESEKEITACIPYLSDLYLYAKNNSDEEGCVRVLNALGRAFSLMEDDIPRSLMIWELASMEDMTIIKQIFKTRIMTMSRKSAR